MAHLISHQKKFFNVFLCHQLQKNVFILQPVEASRCFLSEQISRVSCPDAAVVFPFKRDHDFDLIYWVLLLLNCCWKSRQFSCQGIISVYELGNGNWFWAVATATLVTSLWCHQQLSGVEVRWPPSAAASEISMHRGKGDPKQAAWTRDNPQHTHTHTHMHHSITLFTNTTSTSTHTRTHSHTLRF